MLSTSTSGCSLDRPGTSEEARTLRAELVGRAREIVPVLARNAARTEEQRRVVEENITLIDEAGLYSIMRPKRLGGLETDIRTKLEVSRELARGCGSTAWASTLMNVCAFFAGLFPDQAQRDVWEGSPDNRIAGVLAPSAGATRIDGGYRVTGSWGWASGCLHAQWAVVGFPVPDDRGEIVDQGLALVPMSDLTIEDTWYVAGMRGTGSNTLVARDIVIPEHRVISIPAAIGGRYATEHTDEALYRSAFVPVAAIVLAGPQLGLAQAALDLVIEKAPKRSVSYTFYDTQTEAPTVQLAVAKAASLVDAAHLFAYRAAADIDQAAVDGDVPRLRRAGPGSHGHRGRHRERPRGHPRADLGARSGLVRRGQPAAADLARLRGRLPPRGDQPGHLLRGLRPGSARPHRRRHRSRLEKRHSMRIANLDGRLVLLEPGTDPDEPRGIDAERAGWSDADPQAVYGRWAEFREWAATASFADAVPVDVAALGPVTPRPPQVFGIGLNYRDHAAESGFALPTDPVVFTKYPSSFTGPAGDIRLSPGQRRLGGRARRRDRRAAATGSPRPTAGTTSPGSPSARTSPTVPPSSRLHPRSSGWGSPSPASPPSARPWSPPTSWAATVSTPTTSSWGAWSTARASRRAAPRP